jgi:membrane protein implicated in regulation of membrane protease activity
MLIVALVLAVIGLAALVTAVVTSNELIAWVCIAASVIGVLLLIVDAVRERSRSDASEEQAEAEAQNDYVEDYPEEPAAAAETEEQSDAETTAVTTEQREDEDRNGR